MEDKIVVAVWILGAYLIGGIPFGYLIGRMRGVDVRTVGSKNIGATNVFRTVGKKWGLLAFFCDVMKGMLPVLLAKYCIVHNCSLLTAHCSLPSSLPLYVGIACVAGHMLTPYITDEKGRRFHGGKGVATAFGMLLGLIPALVGTAFGIFALVFACSNYISLGSITASAFLAVAIWFPILGTRGYHDIPQCVLVTLISLFIIWKHRANIGRLVHGNENKIYLFKKKV